jgi:hypothetical protein
MELPVEVLRNMCFEWPLRVFLGEQQFGPTQKEFCLNTFSRFTSLLITGLLDIATSQVTKVQAHPPSGWIIAYTAAPPYGYRDEVARSQSR